jgi:hypothetical protein
VQDEALPLTIEHVSSGGGYMSNIVIAGSYAYMGEVLGLIIPDISNPARPQPIKCLPMPNTVLDVQMTDNYLYLATGVSGLHIMNISTPTSPVLTGSLEMTNSAREVDIAGSYAARGQSRYAKGIAGLSAAVPCSPG